MHRKTHICSMIRPLLIIAALYLNLSSYGQYAAMALKKSDIKKYARCKENATLFVVITNEKNSGDAALVNAAKTYWKKGSIKFISRIEFINQISQKKLQVGHYYLYEWVYEGKNKALNYIDVNTLLPAPNSGYFALSLIDPSLADTKTESGPADRLSLFFSLGLVAGDQKGRVLESYYDLMVKYFDHEAGLLAKTSSKTKVKKKNGYYYFENAYKELADRDVLLVKEQVRRKQPGEEKKKKKDKDGTSNVVDQFKLQKKNIYTVFPEDIGMALKKNDSKVVLYCNGMLLSAEDASVLAAQVPSKTSPFLLALIGTGLASTVSVISYILAQQNP